MLNDVVEFLACPVCGGDLRLANGALRCPSKHAFDLARQGYVNLLAPDAATGTADTLEMVQARAAFLGAGHFEPVARRLAEKAAALCSRGLVVDAGAGVGYYLRAVLERLPEARGLALDLSKFALRRAAKAHSRAGAVVCDLWRPFPVRAGVASLVLDLFSPRNGPEYRRILRPDGALLVVTPTSRHLQELVASLGLISVDDRKEERLEEGLSPHFALEEREELTFALSLSRAEAGALARMGPSARHLGEGVLDERLAALKEPVAVTASVSLSTYRPLQ